MGFHQEMEGCSTGAAVWPPGFGRPIRCPATGAETWRSPRVDLRAFTLTMSVTCAVGGIFGCHFKVTRAPWGRPWPAAALSDVDLPRWGYWQNYRVHSKGILTAGTE